MAKRYRRYKRSYRSKKTDVSSIGMVIGSLILLRLFKDYILALLELLAVAGLLWIAWKIFKRAKGIYVQIRQFYTPIKTETVSVDDETFDEPNQAPKRPPIPKGLRVQVLRRDGFKCVYCGRHGQEVPLEVDHIKPWSLGGKHELANLQTLCRDCNRGKSNNFIG